MARQRVDPVFAALARRRPSVGSEHFGLSYQMTDPGEASPKPRLGFSVPKRQLARAVDRNAVKRVAREAWRHAQWGSIRAPGAAMLKLRRADAQWKSTPRGALKKAWRAELDELFRRLIAKVRAEQRAGQLAQREAVGEPAPARTEQVTPSSRTNRSSP